MDDVFNVKCLLFNHRSRLFHSLALNVYFMLDLKRKVCKNKLNTHKTEFSIVKMEQLT